MSFFPTNANQVQAFAGAMYGTQIGSVTMAQVTSDIAAAGGLKNALNAYYSASFGSLPTATVAATVAANLGLTGAALTSGAAYITAQLNGVAAGARGALISDIVNLFGTLSADATFGAAATAWNTKVAAAVAYTGAANVAAGTVVAAPASVFTLTDDIADTTGTAGNDTFKGIINDDGTDNLSTIQTGDLIDGGAGVDKLEISVIEDAGTTPMIELANVEQVYIRSLNNGNGIDASLWTDVQQIWNNRSTDDLDVANVQAQVVIGAKDISDLGYDVTYEDDALGSDEATQKFVFQDVGDFADKATVELRVMTGGADVVTAVEIDVTGENAVDLYGDIDGFMESVKVTGTGKLYLEDDGDYFDEATLVDLSGNSGGVEMGVTHEDVVVTGGSGDDTITLANGTALTEEASISLGAGNDSLLDDGSDGVGTDAVLDGGAGTDTIASTLLTVGNRANFKGWEALDIAGDNRTIDASLFTASTFSSIAKTDGQAGNVTLSKLAGTKIVINDTSASNDGDTLTATLATATGTADSAEIKFNGDGGSTLANFTTAGLETITIDSQSENTGDANEVTVITTTDNVLSKITITGDKDFTLGGVTVNTAATPTTVTTVTTSTAAALTSIDGSAATGDLDITAGASQVTNNLTMTFSTLTIKTGSGDDSVSIGGRGTVETGKGSDTVNVAVLGVTVNVGVDKDEDTVILADTADYTGATTSSTRFTTITNLGEGDAIDFSSIEATETEINDFTTDAEDFGSLEAAIDGALADGIEVNLFNWVDGNTYLVVDGTNNTVIRLTGTYDVADLSLNAGVITFE
ncbi:hypothetical protein [Limnohabitans sp. Rim28]|uniref:beta strand repeat-containing protein n=1 Tax=Limnohabitans sp. Rim28 TaxID=1100720 RepID=UPI0002D964B0|nr:hypothetical protein [Limnohabitans sp. Rim28]PVE05174.1 hypothetical protein B472_15910 [Limnohabitans sp. Rim28]